VWWVASVCAAVGAGAKGILCWCAGVLVLVLL
jgi:hypothetical protein